MEEVDAREVVLDEGGWAGAKFEAGLGIVEVVGGVVVAGLLWEALCRMDVI